ncbi:OsmC family protein [Coraliomargarita parva]|uniref:OsmC family protein n=1 Tax=Coraliomargarita parva TaxID=3014050 RepID=UPI0022B43F6C|nr:OsmC family protein [Coraliomargarita parva]
MKTTEQTTEEIRNGVNVTALRETIEAVKSDPELADFKFRASNAWEDGSRNLATVRDFHGTKADHMHKDELHVRMDEPPVLLGQDTGLNPVEVLLSALSGCMTTTLAYYSANLGLELESVKSEYEGDIDLKGFLGIDPNIRKGYKEIRVKFRVKGNATEEQVMDIVRCSPVFDAISNPVPIKIEIVKE